MTADEFMKNHQVAKRSSKIEPFLDEIIKLRQNGISYSAILKFLSLNGVEVTMATLSVYMRRHAPPELVPPAKNQPAKASPKSIAATQPEQSSAVPSPESPGSQRPRPPVSKRGQKPEVVINQEDE